MPFKILLCNELLQLAYSSLWKSRSVNGLKSQKTDSKLLPLFRSSICTSSSCEMLQLQLKTEVCRSLQIQPVELSAELTGTSYVYSNFLPRDVSSDEILPLYNQAQLRLCEGDDMVLLVFHLLPPKPKFTLVQP